MSNDQLVSKVWNYAHVLRDQGVSYGDYIEQITYLLFLKMDQEREQLLGELEAIRSRGYALDLEEETPGVRCVAMPVRSSDGMAAGAISISGPVHSITEEKIPRYVKLLSDMTSILATRANLFPSMQIDSPFNNIGL